MMLRSALELRVGFNVFWPSDEFFADCSRAVLLLWIVFVIYASCLILLCCLVCSLQPCGLLFLAALCSPAWWGKGGSGGPLGSFVSVFLAL